MYSDGTLLANGAFSAWSPGEPNDVTGAEDCVNLEYASENRAWNDVSCQTLNAYICQSPLNIY